MKNIFDITICNEIIARIHTLTPESQPLWGKMNVAQMLAHCNVTYETIYTDKHAKPNVFLKFILKLLVKNMVVNETPYKKNGSTASLFIITDTKVFAQERTTLIEHIRKTQGLGDKYFDNKESHSFGILTAQQWNNLFYKHLDHHLRQFNA